MSPSPNYGNYIKLWCQASGLFSSSLPPFLTFSMGNTNFLSSTPWDFNYARWGSSLQNALNWSILWIMQEMLYIFFLFFYWELTVVYTNFFLQLNFFLLFKLIVRYILFADFNSKPYRYQAEKNTNKHLNKTNFVYFNRKKLLTVKFCSSLHFLTFRVICQ